MPKDPVCGMNVPETTQAKSKLKGKTYYFCCESCKWAFDKDPKRFA